MALFHKFQTQPDILNPVEEVCLFLKRLLNTKQGFGAWQQGLGMGDYTYAAASREILQEVGRDIEYNIRHFEPRFKRPSVCLVDAKNGFWACFAVSGTIVEQACVLYILFNKKTTIEVTSHCPSQCLPPSVLKTP